MVVDHSFIVSSLKSQGIIGCGPVDMAETLRVRKIDASSVLSNIHVLHILVFWFETAFVKLRVSVIMVNNDD